MARIRSIHPGIWTDIDFVSVSMGAGQLFIGLLNFADDAGIFEWVEFALKAKIFPTRKIVIKKLLTELVDQGMINQYEVDGKSYGEIRNFTKWQSPKNPVYKYPENPLKVDHNSHESSAKVNQKLCKSSVKVNDDTKKHNKNSNLQKKLSTGKDRIGKERKGKKESPQTPQSKIMTMTEDLKSVLFNESLILLSQVSKLDEEKCRPIIGRWLKQLNGNADRLVSLIDKGLSANKPIPYISKMIVNETQINHGSNVAYFQPRKTNKQQMTEAWGLSESIAEFQEKYGDDEPTLEQLQSHNHRKAWGA